MFDEGVITFFNHTIHSAPAVIALVYWLKPPWYGVMAIAWFGMTLSMASVS